MFEEPKTAGNAPHGLAAASLTGRWISSSTLMVTTPSNVGDTLVLGGTSFGPDALVVRDGDELTILRDGWRLERYLRFRPLVYYAAFGAPVVFQCVHLAVETLFEFGRYQGDVLVLTDTAHLDLFDDLPEAWRAHIKTKAIEANDILDWTLARYRIIDMPELAAYRPFLYLDIDVVCNAPIAPLLQNLAVSDVLHAPAENVLTSPEDSYGASLFSADEVMLAPKRMGFSTGVLGFPSIATVAELFALVPRLAEGYANHVGTRTAYGCFDQPFANYAVVKAGRCELALINHFLENRHYWSERSATLRGLAHFTGGTHLVEGKYPAMAAYVDKLRSPTVA